MYASKDIIHTDLVPISPFQDNPRGFLENTHKNTNMRCNPRAEGFLQKIKWEDVAKADVELCSSSPIDPLHEILSPPLKKSPPKSYTATTPATPP